MDIKFCENLKSVRLSCNLTQKQVAEKLGVVVSCYANWEQGRTEPSVEMLKRLAKIYQVTTDYLLGLTEL